MRRLFALASLLVLVFAVQGCGWSSPFKASTTVTQTVDHLPGSALKVETLNGRVDVLVSEATEHVVIDARLRCGGSTQVEADQRLPQARLDVSRDTARTLWIKPVFPGGRRNGDSASISVKLPDVDGVTIKTSNGAVFVRDTAGKLVVDTSNGAISVTDHDGNALIDTSNGSIRVTRLRGDLVADTSNGSVDVDELAGSARVDTSNGPIIFSLIPDQAGPIELDTSNGSISLTIGPAFSGAMTLRTSNGSISIHDPTGVIRSQEIGKNRAKLTIGEGGSSSRLSTSNGRITLTVRP